MIRRQRHCGAEAGRDSGNIYNMARMTPVQSGPEIKLAMIIFTDNLTPEWVTV